MAREATKEATSSGTGGAKAATEVEEEEEGAGGTKEQPTQANHPPTMQGTSHQYHPCEFYKVHKCCTYPTLLQRAVILIKLFQPILTKPDLLEPEQIKDTNTKGKHSIQSKHHKRE